MADARSPDMPDVPTSRLIRPGSSLTRQPKNPYPRTAVSSLGAFAICPQNHGFGYDLQLTPTEAINIEAREVGTLVHVGLAYRYGMLMNPRPEWLVYPSPQAPDPRQAIWTLGQHNIEAATKALFIFDHYQAYYGPSTWRPIMVEQQLEALLTIDGRTERYTLRVDLAAIDERTGEAIVVDHKTAYKLTRSTGYDYRTDREMMTALMLLRLYGFDVKRVVINAMTKGTRDEPTPRFGRYDVPISAEAYNRLGEDTAYWIRQIRAVQAAYPDARKRPRVLESCMRKYGRCDFYPLCAEGDSAAATFKNKWGS